MNEVGEVSKKSRKKQIYCLFHETNLSMNFSIVSYTRRYDYYIIIIIKEITPCLL